jgi:hypothetical protein
MLNLCVLWIVCLNIYFSLTDYGWKSNKLINIVRKEKNSLILIHPPLSISKCANKYNSEICLE